MKPNQASLMRKNRQVELQLKQIEEKKKLLAEELPHLYGWKWYKWAKKFFQSRNKMNLLCAANQISKSSTQIRKCIEWAGNYDLWPELWPDRKIRQMWYLYPSKELLKQEWLTKWVEQMPRGSAKKHHPKYGWEEIKDKGEVSGIKFNSGMYVFFRTYGQKASNLQAGTLGAIFTDEELPEELYDELNMRLAGTQGYFHMVFTATLNQPIWQQAIEGKGEKEKWPHAFKQQVSMYECLEYEDGSPGAFTKERIEEIKRSCKSREEVQRRVYGRFVTEIGRKYPQFNAVKNVCKPYEIPSGWKHYTAVDLGSGGQGHPPAYVFVAMRPDGRKGAVYKGWIGNDGQNYTNGDVYRHYIEDRGDLPVVEQRYDQQSRDFKTISDRAGDNFLGSNKKHTDGEEVVNDLFKGGILDIFDIPELEVLVVQLATLMKSTLKKNAKDDFADALRYCVVSMPWDWTVLRNLKSQSEIKKALLRPITDEERVRMEIEERRGQFYDPIKDREQLDASWGEWEDEIDEWNDRYVM